MKNPLQYHKGDKIFWFRIFGKGLKFAKTPMLFSERNGLTKYWKVFGWRVTWLPKWKSLKDYPLTPKNHFEGEVVYMNSRDVIAMFNEPIKLKADQDENKNNEV